jgi:hypothetical protein
MLLITATSGSHPRPALKACYHSSTLPNLRGARSRRHIRPYLPPLVDLRFRRSVSRRGPRGERRQGPRSPVHACGRAAATKSSTTRLEDRKKNGDEVLVHNPTVKRDVPEIDDDKTPPMEKKRKRRRWDDDSGEDHRRRITGDNAARQAQAVIVPVNSAQRTCFPTCIHYYISRSLLTRTWIMPG